MQREIRPVLFKNASLLHTLMQEGYDCRASQAPRLAPDQPPKQYFHIGVISDFGQLILFLLGASMQSMPWACMDAPTTQHQHGF
jgi:hypothetical protein